ncbi:MAG: phosphoadenosine phosphosulfate reductase family protein [Promethearchaeota archaeon]
MPSKVFLGPNLNFWCNNCNIPILETMICPICGSTLKKLSITPPYEITPAFEKDLHLIRRTIDAQFGKGIGIQLIPTNKIILLNKAPYFDRMDEVIIDGFVLGNIRFNPLIMQWEFIPKIEGSRRIAELSSKKWLQIDDGAINNVAKGANVLAPGVIDYDKEFKEGDHLIILTLKKQAIATGLAKYSANDLEGVKRGIVVKTKNHDFPKDPQIRPAGQDWKTVINANRRIIESRVNRVKKFILKTVKKFHDYPNAVSFSGGKDSLCLLLLVLETLGPTDVFFINTGIEFEETVNYTNEIIRELGLSKKFSVENSKESFWDNLKKFGIPSKDYRWCCKVIKLASITNFLNKRYPGTKVVTFIGSRQYESSSRYHYKKISINSFLPQQISVSPIHKWSSLHVWIYLLSKQVKINPLYFKGYKRIGCIYCPATKLSELELLNESHPDLYTRWMEFLKKWAEKYDLSTAWAERGFWRLRKFKERGQINLAKELGVSQEEITWHLDEKLKFHIVQGINPCQEGSFSIQGRIEGYLHLDIIMNHLGILGQLKYSQELGVISLRAQYFTLNLFSDGTITIRGNKKTLEKYQNIIFSLIKRANNCIGCGICIPFCPQKALYLKGNKVWVDNNCKFCFACFEKCPVLKYTT